MYRYIFIILLTLVLSACGSTPSAPTNPDTETPTEGPAEPGNPDDPADPTDPTDPTNPSDPDDPTDPEPNPEDPAPPPDEPETSDLQGAVTGWSSGEADITATIYGGGDAEANVVSGTIGAGGDLSADLTDTVADVVLSGFPSCDNLTVSDPAVRQATFSALTVQQGDASLGRVALASSLAVLTDGLTQIGDYYVQQTYSDRAATVKGECPVGGTPATFRYNLTLVAGWNAVTFELVEKVDDAQVLELTNGVPEGAQWFYMSP